ncbi:ABC transporter substrate-binding protein [Actinokineospora auranticolor]|uniref:ABC-type nitrate/sulfonate/bicarbonate transport system substrate-binding protein n=1 Tax=Actinokineospora auranticolor TaxID=155976 RepID=A0A2S6GIL9_9PSEU|nr:ABC transporter substrate-binding protein [Actinokineospora auranticolor]PPK65033.1 ABC-type nitrate/sulfonate/bicarbonate transport system substrate-binding protein [Actinokineospora auranticolor]
MRTTSRRAFLGLTALGATALVTACGRGEAAGGAETKKLRYQGWVGQVTLPELAKDLGYLGDLELEWVGNTTSGPQDIQSAATGQVDFGGAFNGAVVKLVASKAPIVSVISYYGSDKDSYTGYFVLDSSPIRTPADLVASGAKVGMNTLGAHAEAILDTYLELAGIAGDEAKKVERLALPPVNTEQSLRQRQIQVAALSGILRDKALAAGGLRPLFTDFELLGPFSAGTYVMTKRFVQENPNTTTTFVTGVAKALDWSRDTPREQVIARMRDIVAKRGRSEDSGPLAFWKSFGVAERGGVIRDQEFALWLDWLGKRGDVEAGSLKPSDLYTNQYNKSGQAGG